MSVPSPTAKEIQKLAKDVGLSEATFTSAALVFGARALARQYSPERFMPKDAWEALARMGLDVVKEQERQAESDEKA